MEENKLPLENLVYSEPAMLELLGIGRETLDTLRLEKGLPFVRLTSRARIYLADEVLGWLKRAARTASEAP